MKEVTPLKCLKADMSSKGVHKFIHYETNGNVVRPAIGLKNITEALQK